jgi:hypothetical protein
MVSLLQTDEMGMNPLLPALQHHSPFQWLFALFFRNRAVWEYQKPIFYLLLGFVIKNLMRKFTVSGKENKSPFRIRINDLVKILSPVKTGVYLLLK